MFAQESTIFLPNVFAIKTPVAIAIGVRYGNPQPQKPAKVRYTRIAGSREEKLSKLDTIRTFDDVEWQDCLDGWMQPFLPKGKGDYYAWPPLTCLFPWQHSGVQFKRTWPIGETAELLKQRWAILLASPPSGRAALVRETGARRANAPYESFLSN